MLNVKWRDPFLQLNHDPCLRESVFLRLVVSLGDPKLNYGHTHTYYANRAFSQPPKSRLRTAKPALAHPEHLTHPTAGVGAIGERYVKLTQRRTPACQNGAAERALSVGKRALGQTPRRPNAPSTQATVNSSESTAHLPWNMPVWDFV